MGDDQFKIYSNYIAIFISANFISIHINMISLANSNSDFFLERGRETENTNLKTSVEYFT